MSKAAFSLFMAIVGGALGQLLMKAALPLPPWPTPLLFDVIPAWVLANHSQLSQLAAGIFCYIVAMLVWVLALRTVDLSYAYPLLASGYVIVCLGAVVWPGIEEVMTPQKLIGVLLIVAGVSMCSLQKPSEREKILAEPAHD